MLIIRCDHCGKELSAEQWAGDEGKIRTVTPCQAPRLYYPSFDDFGTRQYRVLEFCNLQCLQKWLNQRLSVRSAPGAGREAPAAEHG